MVEVPQDTVTVLLTSLEAVTPARAQRSAACFILRAILNKIARTKNVSRYRRGWQGRAGCRGAVLNGRVGAFKPKTMGKGFGPFGPPPHNNCLPSARLSLGLSPGALLVQLLNRCSVAVLRLLSLFCRLFFSCFTSVSVYKTSRKDPQPLS